MGSLPRGGDVVVYVKGINQLSLPTPVYSVLVSISVFMALSPVFHSINSPNDSPLYHSVLPVSNSIVHSVLPILILPYRSFQLYISV